MRKNFHTKKKLVTRNLYYLMTTGNLSFCYLGKFRLGYVICISYHVYHIPKNFVFFLLFRQRLLLLVLCSVVLVHGYCKHPAYHGIVCCHLLVRVVVLIESNGPLRICCLSVDYIFEFIFFPDDLDARKGSFPPCSISIINLMLMIPCPVSLLSRTRHQWWSRSWFT